MCSAQGNRADISNPSVRCGDTESRQGTEAMLRSSRANIKSCCPGPSGLHHCVSSKGLTCAVPTASMAAYTVPTACRVLSWLILFPAPFLNRYFINLASLPCWGLPCISFLLHSCISTLFPFRVSLSILPSQILFHVSCILYPCTTRVTWPTPVSASSLTSTQAPWDKSGLRGPGWLNMRKHFCRQSCVSEAPQSLVSKLTLTNDLNLGMDGIWLMPEASSRHHSYGQNAKCSACLMSIISLKAVRPLAPALFFIWGQRQAFGISLSFMFPVSLNIWPKLGGKTKATICILS